MRTVEGGTSVYFVQPVAGGLIKIGKAVNVASRLAEIQSMCPIRLRLLAEIPGSYKLESTLHRRFAHARSHGEWFRPTSDLVAHIAGIAGAISPIHDESVTGIQPVQDEPRVPVTRLTETARARIILLGRNDAERAGALGTTRATYYRWMRGANVSCLGLHKVADALQMSIDETWVLPKPDRLRYPHVNRGFPPPRPSEIEEPKRGRRTNTEWIRYRGRVYPAHDAPPGAYLKLGIDRPTPPSRADCGRAA